MHTVPLPHAQEDLRLLILDQCGVLDTPPEPDFDSLARLAAHLARCPIGLVSIVDEQRQWFKARVGLSAPQTPRSVSFCGHVVQLDAELVVPNALKDPRFAENPLVVGPPHVIFYAGFPLRVGEERLPLGTLCVIDHEPREFTADQLEALRTLARQLELLLEARLRERKLREFVVRVQEAEARSAAILEAMGDGLVKQSAGGPIEWSNAAAERILGLTADQLCGRTLMDPRWRVLRGDGSPLPADEHPATQALATGQPVRNVLVGMGVEGQPRWLRVNAQPMFRKGEAQPCAVLTSLSDVSELREKENQLLVAKEQAERAGRAKAEFLATMSHELRTPMNGVIGMTDLLLSDVVTDEQREQLTVVRESGRALLHLINDILDFSKIEAGGRVLVPAVFEVARLARETTAMLRHEVDRKGLSFELDCARVSRLAWADIDATRQVLLNLLGNAVKFTMTGRVRLVAFEQADQLVLAVEDEGIGIRPENLSRLFQRFSQAETTTARRFGGTGLGLAICRHLVEGMAGTIRVESTWGKGSRFIVTLPLAASGVTVPAAVVVDLRARPARPGLRVLLVEDNPINQRVAMGMLTRLGHQVQLARDGFEGVLAATTGHFDLVLMDVQMPGLDGLEATQQIRKHEQAQELRRAPIYALTASVLANELDACLQAGMDQVLLKPLTMDTLQRSLDAVGEPALRAVAS